MRICGHLIPGTSNCKVSMDAIDVTIALVSVVALGIILAGVLHIGGVASVGLFAHSGAVFVGVGGGLLAIDVLIGAVKMFTNTNKEIAVNGDINVEIDKSITSKEVIFAFNELKNCAQNAENWDEEVAADLVNKCTLLKLTIENLDPNEKKKNKSLINSILNLKFSIKEKFKDVVEQHKKDSSSESNLYVALKDLQRVALRYYFSKEVDAQVLEVAQLEERFTHHREFSGHEEAEFLREAIDRWKRRLEAGKPISIPKWYHCTRQAETLDKIANSEIKVMHLGTYKGAFASNHIETGYGDVGISLSTRIEKTATKGKTPLFSSNDGQGKVIFEETPGINIDDGKTTLENKQDGTRFWAGFQNPIPIKRVDKKANPLKFYKDNTIAYLFHQSRISDGEENKMQALAKSIKIPLATYPQAEALRSLIASTFPFKLPKDWQEVVQEGTKKF